MATFNWFQRARWAALAAAGACALLLVALVALDLFHSGIGIWGKLFVAAVGIFAGTAVLLSDQSAAPNEQSVRSSPMVRRLSFFFVALMAAIAAIAATKQLVEDDSAALPKSEAPGSVIAVPAEPIIAEAPRIRLKLPGRWGERGCGVIYRFRIHDQAVLVDSVSVPPGEAPHQFVATILHADEDVMEVRGEEPAGARGVSVTFTYDSNGPLEWLTWNDQLRGTPLKLHRCQ